MTKPVALITGGSRGIGLGIAKSLVSEGYDVAVAGRRKQADVESSLAELREAGADVLYCQGDISKTDDRLEFVDAIREHFGKLNVLVNNAGIAPSVRTDLLEASEQEFERVLKVNLQGAYFLTQACANWMVQLSQVAGWKGCIINVSSISAILASTNRGEYCISKAGLSMATQLWAMRLAEYNIPVYELRPGITRTDMTAPVKEKYDAMMANGLVPQNRWGESDDNGRAVAALVRGDFAYSTGQVITTDGGLTIPRL